MAIKSQSTHAPNAAVTQILSQYFSPLICRFLGESGTMAVVIGKGGYTAASPALRRYGIDVDRWPVPPAGLFVVEERTVYLRTIDAMTVIHEHGHALDCALGNGVYRSRFDERIRNAYRNARRFVTPYAASAIDEYVAEGIRAIVGANVAGTPWPPVSPERFAENDPHGFDVIRELMAEAELRVNFKVGEQMSLEIAA